ncbi:tubulin binding cofactor A [Protomyces lactucae-debilis]|uniref:Tubulin-specific chaperone A n=1 Tax=Protomyces lactucae-debilis TaxID=2754530 RepID=A0A1Y2F433_PROLT|nr:tubulin binding cofactor A [Protomyces lactucae-debilis]ORY78244.1 tubulin binding cofactor A [Protomyces lactucae-debilis]
MSDIAKIVSIKTGTVKRLTKDYEYSKKEVTTEQERYEKLKANGGDEYELRAQQKVVADAEQMIPDYKKRLAKALEELEEFTDSSDPAVTSLKELSAAKDVAAAAKAIVGNA